MQMSSNNATGVLSSSLMRLEPTWRGDGGSAFQPPKRDVNEENEENGSNKALQSKVSSGNKESDYILSSSKKSSSEERYNGQGRGSGWQVREDEIVVNENRLETQQSDAQDTKKKFTIRHSKSEVLSYRPANTYPPHEVESASEVAQNLISFEPLYPESESPIDNEKIYRIWNSANRGGSSGAGRGRGTVRRWTNGTENEYDLARDKVGTSSYSKPEDLWDDLEEDTFGDSDNYHSSKLQEISKQSEKLTLEMETRSKNSDGAPESVVGNKKESSRTGSVSDNIDYSLGTINSVAQCSNSDTDFTEAKSLTMSQNKAILTESNDHQRDRSLILSALGIFDDLDDKVIRPHRDEKILSAEDVPSKQFLASRDSAKFLQTELDINTPKPSRWSSSAYQNINKSTNGISNVGSETYDSFDDVKESQANHTHSEKVPDDGDMINFSILEKSLNSSKISTEPWYYLDPSGNRQGPFTALDMRKWFDSGYFADSLPICQGPSNNFTPLFQHFSDITQSFVANAKAELALIRFEQLKHEEILLEQQRLEIQHREQAEAKARFEREQRAFEEEKARKKRLLEVQIEAERIAAENLKKENELLEMERERLRLERLRLEKENQERLHLEQLEQEKLRAKQIRSEQLQEKKLKIEQLKQERLKQENIVKEQLKNEKLLQEQIKLQEQLHRSQLKKEELRIEQLRQKQRHDDKLRSQTPKASDQVEGGLEKAAEYQDEISKSDDCTWSKVQASRPTPRNSKNPVEEMKYVTNAYTLKSDEPKKSLDPKADEMRKLEPGSKPASSGIFVQLEALTQVNKNANQKESKSMKKMKHEAVAREKAAASTRASAWGLNPSGAKQTDQARKPKPLSIEEIQREEEEKSAQKLKEAEQLRLMLGLNTPILQHVGSWKAVSSTKAVSMKNILKEEEDLKAASRNGNEVGGGGWVVQGSGPVQQTQRTPVSTVPKSNDVDFWGTPKPSQSPSISAVGGQNKQKKHSEPAAPVVQSRTSFGGMGMPPDMALWAKAELKKLGGSSDITLLDFCMSVSDASEVREVLAAYLGSTPQVSSFASSFLQRKNALKKNSGKGAGVPKDTAEKKKKLKNQLNST